MGKTPVISGALESNTASSGHSPVLLPEVIAAMAPEPGDKVVDATYGRGGHAGAILDRIGATGALLAFDRDPEAIGHALETLGADPRVTIFHASFDQIARETESLGLLGKIQAAVFDLGVSSPQLDDLKRGFSFRSEGSLDMRMDPTSGVSAGDWLARADAREIAKVLHEFGEEPRARRIARAIVARRRTAPIQSAADLARLVAETTPPSASGKHPATRVFLALRIHVNDELSLLSRGLEAAFSVLAPRGRLAVISFHSLEDRIIKQCFRKYSGVSVFPRRLPVTEQQLASVRRGRLVGSPIRPSAEEIKRNPRARSATLRVIEREA